MNILNLSGCRFFLRTTLVSALKYATSVLPPGNQKEFRAVCTNTGFIQFLHAVGKCGTV